MHNGRDFGKHEAEDPKLNGKVTASFIKISPEEEVRKMKKIMYSMIYGCSMEEVGQTEYARRNYKEEIPL